MSISTTEITRADPHQGQGYHAQLLLQAAALDASNDKLLADESGDFLLPDPSGDDGHSPRLSNGLGEGADGTTLAASGSNRDGRMDALVETSVEFTLSDESADELGLLRDNSSGDIEAPLPKPTVQEPPPESAPPAPEGVPLGVPTDDIEALRKRLNERLGRGA